MCVFSSILSIGKHSELTQSWQMCEDDMLHVQNKTSSYMLILAPGYKTFFILNSVEHEIFPANKH